MYHFRTTESSMGGHCKCVWRRLNRFENENNVGSKLFLLTAILFKTDLNNPIAFLPIAIWASYRTNILH